jgi:hypothetical protein
MRTSMRVIKERAEKEIPVKDITGKGITVAAV